MTIQAQRFLPLQWQIEKLVAISPVPSDAAHSRLTLAWLLRLAPEAPEALIIAALAHDLDRAITGITERDMPQGMNKRDFKQAHAARSAGFIAPLMRAYGYADTAIAAVQHLVENHEQGVDRESTLLMDADSLAFFQDSIPTYLERNGLARTRKKIEEMYRRLSDQDGKRLAETIDFSSDTAGELYRQATADLRKV